ncbi:MAG: hypothetical protein E7090_07905 [Bacteroidales bacterium]|nr:hypothetical protein [Bacteroidales bacterium]
MQKNFSFKGITRNTDALYAKEGECTELVNMRLRNGTLIPMSKPLQKALLPYKYSSIFRHETAKTYLCVTQHDGMVHLYDDDFKPLGGTDDNTPALLSPHCIGVKRIEFMGNIVSIFTDNTTYYAIYDTNCYKWLGECPMMPALSFTINSQVHEIVTENAYYIGYANMTGDDATLWKNASAGYFDECIANLNERGCYIDRALFRYAFRLFDGSYAYMSPIYYVEDINSIAGVGRDSQNFYSLPLDASNQPSRYRVKVQGFKPNFKFEEYNLEEWENIIVSIDVFTSGSIPGHKIVADGNMLVSRRDNTYQSTGSTYERYQSKTTTEIYSDVVSQQLFYKVAEFDLRGMRVDELKNVSFSNLALSTMLPDDTTSHIRRAASYTYVFNGRLHMAGLRERLFSGYEAHAYLPATMEHKKVSAVTVTEITTVHGTSVVKCDYGDAFLMGYADGKYYLTPFIMYPDARATKITFYITIDGTLYCRTLKLTRHKTLNIAYFLNEAGDGITVSLSGEFANSVTLTSGSVVVLKKYFSYTPGTYEAVYTENGEWLYGEDVLAVAQSENRGVVDFGGFRLRGTLTPGDKITITLSNSDVSGRMENIENICVDELWQQISALPEIQERNTVETRGNILKVSEVDNPFFFPAKQTYAPSNKDIIAVCSNTVALSQGQFGEHPLYVFCANGIWAMAADASGTLAYSAAYPMSREVCINANSVRAIDSGVVFITDKGVMMLSGGKATLLSDALNVRGKNNEQPTDDNVVSRVAAIASLDNVLRDEDFALYCKNASVGFFYSERELVLSNAEYTYSYVFSFESGQWSKYTATFDFISGSYPHFMGIKGEKAATKVLVLHNDNTGGNSVLLLSRPLLCGTKLHKRIMQLVLHASVKPYIDSAAFHGLACYVLCSNDGKNFKLVSGSERQTEFCDMVFPYVPTQSYRYLAIAIVGNITLDSSIAAVEMDINVAWNNKLN